MEITQALKTLDREYQIYGSDTTVRMRKTLSQNYKPVNKKSQQTFTVALIDLACK